MVMRNSQLWFLARKTLGATNLKLGMDIQLHSGSNVGCVPPGHSSSFLCVRQKMPKMVFQKKHLSGVRDMNPYIFGIDIIWGMF